LLQKVIGVVILDHLHRPRLPQGNGGDWPRRNTPHRMPPCEELDPAAISSQTHWGELIAPHRHPGYLNRWVTGLAKAAAAIRINHSGIPTNPMAVRCMVPSIRKICHSVNSSKT